MVVVACFTKRIQLGCSVSGAHPANHRPSSVSTSAMPCGRACMFIGFVKSSFSFCGTWCTVGEKKQRPGMFLPRLFLSCDVHSAERDLAFRFWLSLGS